MVELHAVHLVSIKPMPETLGRGDTEGLGSISFLPPFLVRAPLEAVGWPSGSGSVPPDKEDQAKACIDIMEASCECWGSVTWCVGRWAVFGTLVRESGTSAEFHCPLFRGRIRGISLWGQWKSHSCLWPGR